MQLLNNADLIYIIAKYCPKDTLFSLFTITRTAYNIFNHSIYFKEFISMYNTRLDSSVYHKINSGCYHHKLRDGLWDELEYMEKYYTCPELSGYDHLLLLKDYVSTELYSTIWNDIMMHLGNFTNLSFLFYDANCEGQIGETEFDKFVIAGRFVSDYIFKTAHKVKKVPIGLKVYSYGGNIKKIEDVSNRRSETDYEYIFDLEKYDNSTEMVRVVKTPYKSPSHILMSIDLDTHKVLFNGKDIYVTKRFLFSLENNCVISTLYRFPFDYLIYYSNRLNASKRLKIKVVSIPDENTVEKYISMAKKELIKFYDNCTPRPIDIQSPKSCLDKEVSCLTYLRTYDYN